jgi:hypothetical protein
MSEFWLVSAPGDPKPEDTWTLIKDRTGSFSVNYKFHIPSELKVSIAANKVPWGVLDTVLYVRTAEEMFWLVLSKRGGATVHMKHVNFGRRGRVL